MAGRREKFSLVIGGAGFLGQRLAEQLLDDGKRVRCFDMRASPDPRVESVTGDLRSLADVSRALEGGVDTVYHTASLTETNGPRALFHDINVRGTENVIAACCAAGVTRLVYTSSASVVFAGQDIHNGDETLPYPVAFLDAYSESKAAAERVVLAANGRATPAGPLLTTAIRPHTIFGPRDVHVFPRIFANAAAGKMRYVLGSGRELHDYTFVDNCVHGHRLAALSLCQDAPSAAAAGQAYFITNEEPRLFWDTTYALVNRMGYDARPRVRIPASIAAVIAWVLMALAWLVSPLFTFRPTLTRYVVANVTTSHYFKIDKARRDLGYKPVVPLDEAFDRTIAWFQANGYSAGGSRAGGAH